jgi:hypothetical protein
MTVTVDAAAFRKAAEHFAAANGVAAQTYQGMVSVVGGLGAMAGDDKTSDDFAAGYDQAAADTMAAVRDLVGALAALARITSATAANHEGANAASVYSDNPPPYTGGQFDALPDSTVSVETCTPPSAVGGDDPNTPEFWDMITDYLEGWTWPGADTAKLRQAGEAWRRFGQVLRQSIAPYLDSAAAEIGAQRSPEVETAVQVTKGMVLELEQLEVHCADLGGACEDYATQVEQVREVVKGIMRDLAIEVGLTVVVSGILSFFSAGAAAGGGTVVAGWRLSSAARRVIAAFSAMKAAVHGAAVVRLTRIASKIPVLGRRFRRISEAANRAKHEKYLSELRAAMGKPHTKDADLGRMMDKLYRDNASVGSGSTAAAVRHELATNTPVGGVWHTQKAEDAVVFMQRWLRDHPTATPGDRAAAENVLRDLQDALAGR